MPSTTDITVLIPCFAEEENLRILLPRLNKVLLDTKMQYEVLIVDTATPLDNTKSACSENDVRYMNRERGNSFGDAIRTGIQAANGKYLIIMDGDGSHSPEFIPELLKNRETADVVIASRYIEGGYSENSKPLWLMSRALNLSYAIILNLKCKDVSNSFKLYQADQIKSLKLSCENFDIVEEILYKLRRRQKNFIIKEVPFSFKKRMFGETKRDLLLFMFTYLTTIIKLRFMR